MELIVITHPEMLPGEAGIINQLFQSGLARLHVRKPDVPKEVVQDLLENITPAFRNRIALHQHHELADAFGITGLHFTERARLELASETWNALKGRAYTLSTSLHDPAQLETLSHDFDYAFLGPVFDSISKEGYAAKLPSDFKLNPFTFPNKVIALGGINAENLGLASQMGFAGAALLGAIWQNPDQAVVRFAHLKSLQLEPPFVDRLHFISNETHDMSHIDSIRLALEAGCRWIQLRVKGRPEAEVLPIAWEATRLCDAYGARLIINDFPRVALAVQAYGLHLGLTDMPVPEARALVGNKIVVGGTANTWEDIELRIREGADYIGLGPFRFTSTKQNLSPILGVEGYAALMQKMAGAGFSTPIIAIGGVTPADIPVIRSTGIYGVAMSAALTGATDPGETFYQIQQALC